MPVQKVTSHSAQLQLDLAVRHDGASVVVSPGSFRIGETEHELLEEQVADLSSNESYAIQHRGLLVREKDSGEVFVLVDECRGGGTDSALVIGDEDGLELLYRVFNCRVQAGQNPEEATVQSYHVVAKRLPSSPAALGD
jgi:hypothetical protein